MSESAAALGDLAALRKLLEVRPTLPERPACQEQAAALFRNEAAPELPSGEVLEILREELRRACAGGDPSRIPPRTLRRAPLVFWDRDPQAAAFPGLLEAFLDGAASKPRWLRELVEAWLRDFGPDRARLPEAGRAAANLLARTQDPRLGHWDRAHRRYAMFDAARGPERVGSALLTGTEPVDAVLSQTGMDDPIRAEGRFFRAAVKAMLATLPTALRGGGAREAWTRAAAILEVQRTRRDRLGREIAETALRVPDLIGEVIVACLDPWLRDPPPKPEAPREEIKAFLLRVVGDPRLRPDRWSAAPESCAQRMRSWLAEASLETFFALISETNDDPQWRYRRAFWRACLRKMPKDRPAEVWVVLGPGMAARAKAVRDLANAHGRMEVSGQYGEQAVLLLRLGNIVLSEWSNVGPVRAWQVGDRRCPALYRAQYDPQELRARCLDFPDHPILGRGGAFDGKGLWHRSPQTGLWQGCAAAFLENHTELRLTPKDYMTV
jgi:hypothetical protein